MRILQSDCPSSLKSILIEVAANANQEKIEGIDNKRDKKTGIWYWEIDWKRIDIEKLKNLECPDEINGAKEAFIQRLEKLKPKECLDFDHFISMVCNQVTIDSKLLIVKGDITNGWIYSYSNRLTELKYIFDFHYKHDLKKVKKLCVYGATEPKLKFTDLNDSCIKALVEVCVNPQNADIYLKAHEIEVEGKCSRKQEYAELQELYSEFIPSSPREISLSSEKPAIAVIFKEGTKGYDDFARVLYKPLKGNLKECCVDSMNNISQIVDYINKINEDNLADFICIVRGGGNPEELCIYNNKELLDAIKDSHIPILVGIGHASDELVAKEISGYGAHTPTKAADLLNKAYNTFRKAKKEENEKVLAQTRQTAEEERIKNRNKIAKLEYELVTLKREKREQEDYICSLTKEQKRIISERDSLLSENRTLKTQLSSNQQVTTCTQAADANVHIMEQNIKNIQQENDRLRSEKDDLLKQLHKLEHRSFFKRIFNLK